MEKAVVLIIRFDSDWSPHQSFLFREYKKQLVNIAHVSPTFEYNFGIVYRIKI